MTSSPFGAHYSVQKSICLLALVSAGCVFYLAGSLSSLTTFYTVILLLAVNVMTACLVLRSQAAAVSLNDQVRILEQTHDAIIVRDMEYRITHWNRGAMQLFGWSSEETRGRRCYTLLSAEQSSLALLADQLHNNDRWEGEELYQRRDGAKVYVSSRWTVRRDKNGIPQAIISASNDITAIRQAEEALHHSQTQLVHAGRISMLGELMASITHEVNQPLAAISTYGAASLRWLERDTPNIDEARQAITRMINDSRRASEIIKRIRALSIKGDTAHTPLELNTIIEESLTLLNRELARKNIALFHDLDPLGVQVNGDRIQLQQVIINLIINSAQAISAASLESRQIRVRTRQQAASVLIEISDSGPGFETEQLPLVFDAFFTTKREGMGLGLSICKSIVESHAGKIQAQNINAGQGASIKILFPRRGEG